MSLATIPWSGWRVGWSYSDVSSPCTSRRSSPNTCGRWLIGRIGPPGSLGAVSAGAVFDADVRLDEAGRLTLRLSAHYHHDGHSVWQALTDDDELPTRAPWQATIDPVAGGVVTVRFPDGHTAEGEVIDAERPRRLVLRLPEDWGGNDEMLRWELQPTDRGGAVVFDVTIDDAELVKRAAAVWD